MEVILIKAGQLVLSLSILVVFHELGHFIPAKLFKTKVEKFYLFFDPWFSLFKIKKGETEYGIGWVPLGGYVKIAGMIDESMDKKQLEQEPQPWEFRSKPAWQRLIIMIGGVTVNVILAAVISAFVMFKWGEKTLPVEHINTHGGIAVDSLGYKMGFRNGDKLISYGANTPITDFLKIPITLLEDQPSYILVERNGQSTEVPISKSAIKTMLKQKNKSAIITPRIPFKVDTVLAGKKAEELGLMKGDQMIALNGKSTYYFDEFVGVMSQQEAGDSMQLAYLRGMDTATVTFVLPEDKKIGIGPQAPESGMVSVHYSFLKSIPAGIAKTHSGITSYLKQLRLIFDPEMEANNQVGGPIAIANIFAPEWDWERFWNITAMISIMLAVMNLLPIPALDGGHVLFLIYEIITGRKPHDKVLEYAQMAGMAIIFALMIFAFYNDFKNFVFN